MWTTFQATIVKEENNIYLVRLADGTELTAIPSDPHTRITIGTTMTCRSKKGLNYIVSVPYSM